MNGNTARVRVGKRSKDRIKLRTYEEHQPHDTHYNPRDSKSDNMDNIDSFQKPAFYLNRKHILGINHQVPGSHHRL
jgi:hypothetical protein